MLKALGSMGILLKHGIQYLGPRVSDMRDFSERGKKKEKEKLCKYKSDKTTSDYGKGAPYRYN